MSGRNEKLDRAQAFGESIVLSSLRGDPTIPKSTDIEKRGTFLDTALYAEGSKQKLNDSWYNYKLVPELIDKARAFVDIYKKGKDPSWLGVVKQSAGSVEGIIDIAMFDPESAKSMLQYSSPEIQQAAKEKLKVTEWVLLRATNSAENKGDQITVRMMLDNIRAVYGKR